MNEQIKELILKAGFPKFGEMYVVSDGKELEKFAELIVRESAQFICVLDAEPVSHISAARMLLEHFGVE
jgi:hypothetical protein